MQPSNQASLILEDGHVFHGEAFGARCDTLCEVVFSTAMTGYVETITDPAHTGQGVVMTYPLIGNYGTCQEDYESGKPRLAALIVSDVAPLASNFRNQRSLPDMLLDFHIPGVKGVDTRAIVRLLRENGSMRGLLTGDPTLTTGDGLAQSLRRIRSYAPDSLTQLASEAPALYHPEGARKLALVDLGVKRSVVAYFTEKGFAVQTFRPDATAQEILACNPAGIIIGGGPGNPAECNATITLIQALLKAKLPMLGISLGHLVIAIAMGCVTRKMGNGHRGVNHPVRAAESGRVFITAQNHGYVVTNESVDPALARVSHLNVNDGTVEGLQYLRDPVVSVQFYPESEGQPQDTEFMYDGFLSMIGG